MIYDLQKGSLLKRVSAFLLDGILLVILVTGFALGLSAIFGYNTYSDEYQASMERYAKEYGIDFESITTEEAYNALPEAEKNKYEAVLDAMNKDERLLHVLNTMVYIILGVLSASIFLAYAIIEFIFPLIFKNGQTVGKKIFGLGVMRTNGVRIRGVSLFVRTFLGKFVVETMLPTLIIMMYILSAFGVMASLGLIGLILLASLLIGEIIAMAVTKTNSMIHDLVSDCVVVDLASQMIFEDQESMLEYKKKVAEEEATKSYY